MGPCMCGDTYCPSCGPAQGNYQCPWCGEYSADGGCVDPEACAKKDKEETEAMAQQWEEEEIMIAAWKAEGKI